MYTGSQKSHNPYNRDRFNGKKKFFHKGKRNKIAEKIEESKLVANAVVSSAVEAYVPKHAFADFALSDRLKENIAFQKYTAPTPIQDQAIEPILAGRDLIGIANT